MPKRFSKGGRASRFNELGMALHDRGDDLGALDAYLAAIRVQPQWDAPWYNKGLVHKYRGEWLECLEANLQASRLAATNEAAIWNTGIAATALGEWAQARRAWQRFGISVPDGNGPIEWPGQLTPIRVSVNDIPEVVWADRIDPARAIIRSIPLPACGRRWGDLILHDGAPNGYRRLGEREVAVFDELAILAPSTRSTFEVLVSGVSEAEVDALVGVAGASDLPAENWTTHTRVLCKACSEGRPFEQGGHDHGPAVNAQQDEFRVAFSTEDPFTLKQFLSDWHKSHRDASLSTPRCVLDARSESEPPPVA
jgi:hypothetical protein